MPSEQVSNLYHQRSSTDLDSKLARIKYPLEPRAITLQHEVYLIHLKVFPLCLCVLCLLHVCNEGDIPNIQKPSQTSRPLRASEELLYLFVSPLYVIILTLISYHIIPRHVYSAGQQ